MSDETYNAISDYVDALFNTMSWEGFLIARDDFFDNLPNLFGCTRDDFLDEIGQRLDAKRSGLISAALKPQR